MKKLVSSEEAKIIGVQVRQIYVDAAERVRSITTRMDRLSELRARAAVASATKMSATKR